MTEISLIIVIGFLLVHAYYREKQWAQERHEFHNAIIAKNAQEKAQLDVISKPQGSVTRTTELVEPASLTDEQWEKVLSEES